MNKTEAIFLAILKDTIHPAATTNGEYPVSDLADDGWAAVFEVARAQNLFPLVYDAAMGYPAFTDFEQTHPRYFTAATASITTQMQNTEAFLALYRAFLNAGLAPITIKGLICRTLYGERADFRPSGDEDILIEKKDYEKAVGVLTACGYHCSEQPDKKLDVVQEVTFYKENFTIELHLNPFGTETAIREKMNDWFRDVFQTDETVTIRNVPVRTLPPTDHFLFLTFHAFRHFIASGCGIRQMLDILLFMEKYGEKIDWTYVDKGLADVGASGFLADLAAIGNHYLGFDLPPYGEPVCPEALLNDMFHKGTFGNSTNQDRMSGRILTDTIQNKKADDEVQNNRLAIYFRTLFPTWKTWTSLKPYLKDKPWMVFPEWCWRMGRYLCGKTAMGNLKNLNQGYQAAAERMKLLKKYGVL
ncbi:MAG: nucleotidyltransferase family protein [Clostridiales bacterium]|nr:nucleotidyltransferase family protein [Clostridiales bacterium]